MNSVGRIKKLKWTRYSQITSNVKKETRYVDFKNKPELEACRCLYKFLCICFLPSTCIFQRRPASIATKMKNRFWQFGWNSWIWKSINYTPLWQDDPSGNSIEFTVQVPISHWQVNAVTLAFNIEVKKRKQSSSTNLQNLTPNR